MQVEIVSNVVFVDLYEKLMAFKVAEPLDPAGAGFAVVFVVQTL